MKQKTFCRILQDLATSAHKAKQYLADKRLTTIEKKIIEGHLLIRNNQNEAVISLLKDLSAQEMPFVEGQRKLLIGIAYNNLSRFIDAEIYIKESNLLMEELSMSYFLFTGHFNLFLIYSNYSQIQNMKDALLKLASIPAPSPIQTIRLLRCQFLYAVEVNDVKLANRYLEEINLIKSSMVESDIISHLVCEFMFNIKNEEFARCYLIIDDMKKYRKFHLTENFNFMKKMLDHLTKNTSLYAYDKDFASTPLLLYQLKVIQSLEARNVKEAEQHWQALQAISPSIYASNLNYQGTKCLFSLCLAKHNSTFHTPVINQDLNDSPMVDKLLALLRNSQVPLPKAQIYELIWGETVESKDDLNRLSRLVSKVRTLHDVEIESRKGTYFIEQDIEKKKKKIG